MAEMRIIKLLDQHTIQADDSIDVTTDPATSYGISLRNIEGYASLQVTVTGNGALDCYVLMSNNGTDFIQSESALFSNFTSAGGPGLDGKGLFTVSFGFIARQFGFRFIESGSSESVTVSAWLCLI